MKLRLFTLTAALLLQLPHLAMAADVTAETMKSSTDTSLACTAGLKNATTGFDASKASDKLKHSMLTGNNMEQLTAVEQSVHNGLKAASATCALAITTYNTQLKELAAMLGAGKTPPAGFRAEFDKMDAASKAAIASVAEASKVDVFLHFLHRTEKAK